MGTTEGEDTRHPTGGGDRRRTERRRDDRRAPVPPWRRPLALVAYGVAGTLAVVVLVVTSLGALDGGDEAGAAPAGPIVAAEPPPPAAGAPAGPAAGAPQEAYGTAGYERMVLMGTEARGQRVRTVLYCEAPAPVALQGDASEEPEVQALAGDDRRVRAAVCKWGERGSARREEVLLVIPPHLAEEFAAAPLVEDDFVRRRRLAVELEWVGRSRALALRTAAVLRGVLPPG